MAKKLTPKQQQVCKAVAKLVKDAFTQVGTVLAEKIAAGKDPMCLDVGDLDIDTGVLEEFLPAKDYRKIDKVLNNELDKLFDDEEETQ